MLLGKNPYDDDYEAGEYLARTGFWGAEAAGCLILCPRTGGLLVLLRSWSVLQPGTWGIPGGARKRSEPTLAATSLTETYEETQLAPSLVDLGTGDILKPAEVRALREDIQPVDLFIKGTFRYATFLALLPSEKTPELNWENDDFVWAEYDRRTGLWELPSPLHMVEGGRGGFGATMRKPRVIEALRHYVA